MSSFNYAGIPDKYAGYDFAKVALIPVPYDGTSTWQKGADDGPDAFLNASENMELYDIETDSEVYKEGVFLDGPIIQNKTPELVCESVERRVSKHLENGKLVSLIGGEHSISIGAIRAFKNKYQDLTVVQLDAHADLRPSYNGSKCNHACAMHEASKNCNLIQIGIRSMDRSELEFMDKNKVFFAHQLENSDWHDKAIELITGPVYLTIDLDAFDPSVCPGTGTPEPGGLLWYDTLKFLRTLIKSKKLVGFDIVELMPNSISKSSDFLAAKLYYKILSYQFDKR